MSDTISRCELFNKLATIPAPPEANEFKAEVYKVIQQMETVDKWIPIDERLPEPDKYVLLSFANFTLAEIGRYEVDDDGCGAFYVGDDDSSCSSYGLFVNAWMPLPKPWKGADDDAGN